ncbi:putative germin-like protein 9-2 [Acorus calamus]|uniref:Germin-like protein 9-2 n=1 Tax=Acorus calamus TaxID=4465 RepID=A0AAV9ER94_ACOCL|nr:putative germin-like protein 9-2 [Acorus calamus]
MLPQLPLTLPNAGDPNIISDFIIPSNLNPANVTGTFFTYTGMRTLITADPPKTFTVLKATMEQFPAINGQSVSYAVLLFSSGSVNPPHTHPRSAELLFLVEGSLEVGFVDTTNNNDSAIAVSVFGSASAGTISVPTSVFTSGIEDDILAKSFKTDIAIIQKIKAGLAPMA